MARIFVNLLSYTGKKGGMEKYTRELYRHFGAMDTDHEFVGYASRELMELDVSWFPGEIIDSGISGENRWEWAFGELFRVGGAAKRAGADLIHSPATLGPWRSAMPAVYTMHDLLYFSVPDLMATKSYNRPVQWMEKRAASNAARIITDSVASSEDIQKYLHYPESQIDVIPLAGTPPVATDAGENPEVQSERQRDLFLAVGNRIPHKNWVSLIRALPLIPEEKRPRLVITGSRGDDPLRPVVTELGLEKWVDLKSWIPEDELAWLYANATAIMVPSFHDGFCLPALEAMHVGLPVLSSNIPVYREVCGDAAGYYDPRDLQSIADSMMKAVEEPEWLRDLAERGYARTALFTWERTAQATLESFKRALKA